MANKHTMDKRMTELVCALAKENIPFDIYANRWTDETYFNICIPSIEDNWIDIGFSPSTYGYQLGQFEMLVTEDDCAWEVVRPLKEAVVYIKNYINTTSRICRK